MPVGARTTSIKSESNLALFKDWNSNKSSFYLHGAKNRSKDIYLTGSSIGHILLCYQSPAINSFLGLTLAQDFYILFGKAQALSEPKKLSPKKGFSAILEGSFAKPKSKKSCSYKNPKFPVILYYKS